MNHLASLKLQQSQQMDARSPVLLYNKGDHEIYWLNNNQQSAFRCNTYLIRDGEECLLVDPGGRPHFPLVRSQVEQLLPTERVTGMIISHQDPDVAASMVDWLALNPHIRVFTHPRMHVLLPHYGVEDYTLFLAETHSDYTFPSESRLKFFEAPFLHSPGAIATYDDQSKFLFTSDIWAAVDSEWQLIVTEFERHKPKMDLFHLDYMANNRAARGFVQTIGHLQIEAILPQHGSVITREDVPKALDYLREMRCGADLYYADLPDVLP